MAKRLQMLGIALALMQPVLLAACGSNEPSDGAASTAGRDAPTPVIVTASQLGVPYSTLQNAYEDYGFRFSNNVGTSPDWHTQVRLEVWSETLVATGLTYEFGGDTSEAGYYITTLFDLLTPGFIEANYSPSYYLDNLPTYGRLDLTYNRRLEIRMAYNPVADSVSIRISKKQGG